jgi:glycosyltransferase involved in cell wall biosynthesis
LDIVCLESASEPRRETSGHARIHRLPGNRRWGSGLATYLKEYAAFFFLATAYVSWLSLRRHFDLVQVHNVPDFLVFTAVVPRLQGARLVLDIRDPVPDLYMSKFGGNIGHPAVRATKWIEKVSTGFADLVLTPGEPSRRRLLGRNIPPNKVANVLNSADPALFPAMPQTRAERPADSKFTLVYHGGLFERYGVDIAIKAVNELREQIPGLRLRIAGYGDQVDELQQLIADLHLQDYVTFAGWVAPDKIAGFVAGADLGVVPYRQDTFTDLIYPTKAFECIAVGVPVIMSRLAGVVELFPDVPDLFFQPDDVDDLAQHILRLYNDRSRLKRLNDAMQRAYVPYSWEGQRQEYLSLVGRLVGSN